MRLPCCLCTSPINVLMPEPFFMKIGMCLLASEAIPKTVLHKSLSSACVSECITLISLLDIGSVKTLPRQRIYMQQFEELLDTSFSMLCRIKRK
jgi:hypothetical protein